MVSQSNRSMLGSTLSVMATIMMVVVMLSDIAFTSSPVQTTSILNIVYNGSPSPPPLYSTQDIQTLLNGKKQHLQQVQSALMETSILSDACEMFGQSSSLYASYSSGKSSTKRELLELTKSLEYEIEIIQKMQQDKKSKDEANAKIIADKQEAEAKLLLEKQEAEKKLKQEEEKKIGELTTSSILTTAQSTRFINEILSGVKKNPMKLIYKATVDGFASRSFHSKCDDKGASVTIIKTKAGAIFGGYTKVGWKSGTGNYYSDPSAFLFSLISASKEERFKILDNGGKHSFLNYPHSTYSQIEVGPTFGGGHDFSICSNSNTKVGSYTNLGYSYKGPAEYGSDANKNYLAESFNLFLVSEIEVYTL